jgi:ABC-type sugar transport system permease subunit
MDPSVKPATRESGRLRSRPRLGAGRRDALLFVAPLAILLLVFVYAPMARLVAYSFTEYNGLRPAEWVGLDNFQFLLDWPDFRRAVANTVVLAFGLFVWVGLPFLLAVVLFGRRGSNVVRAILFLPALLPALIVGRSFRLVLAENGPINSALHGIGADALAQPWLSSETWVLPTLIAVIAWATMGTGTLLYSAGLASLSRDYVEAPVTRFWVLLLTIGTVTSFFPWILGLTQGGPGIASVTIDYQVYRSGVQTSRLGLASAIAVVGVVVIAILLAGQLALRRIRGQDDW